MQKEIVNYKSEFFKQQENYISIIKHDFSIPVIAQIRALELLAKETFGSLNIEQKEIVSSTLDSCRTLYNMMSDILCSYNIENKKLAFTKENTDIIKLFKECFAKKNIEYRKKNLFVRINSCEKSHNILCIKHKIKQAFEYIADYCFSQSLNDRHVVCNIINEKEDIIFKIEFENPFIKNEKLNKVGNDLRLNLAKNIIKTHKGKLSVETDYPLNIVNVRLR